MKKILGVTIVGFLILISINSSVSGFETQGIIDNDILPTPITLNWIETGENIALYDNGGRISLDSDTYNVNRTHVENNLCIDGDYSTAVRSKDGFWADAQIEIDLAGDYSYIYNMKITYHAWGFKTKLVVKVHDKDQGWKTVFQGDLITYSDQTKEIGESVRGYYADKIRVKMETTELYDIPKYWFYEIEVFKALKDEESPSATFLCPNQNLPVNTVYYLNQPIWRIPIPFPCSVLVRSRLNVVFKDDLSIKRILVLRDNRNIFEEDFSLNQAKTEVERFINIPDGSAPYSIQVEDFVGNKNKYILNLIGFNNGPACTLSKPIGPSTGKVKKSYTYSISAGDLENDPIQYGWDWNGDGKVDQWTLSSSASHSWSTVGNYKVIVTVREKNTGRLGLWKTSKTVKIEPRLTPDSNSQPNIGSIIITPTTPITPTNNLPSSSDTTQASTTTSLSTTSTSLLIR